MILPWLPSSSCEIDVTRSVAISKYKSIIEVLDLDAYIELLITLNSLYCIYYYYVAYISTF